MNIDIKGVEEIVKKAGNYLLDNFGDSKEQTLESDTHYVTIFDQQVSDFYKKELLINYPDIQFYSEGDESDLDLTKPYWMIDPIEGTSNFAHSIPFFGTQLALIENKEPLYGIVYVPAFKEMYVGIKDGGAYCNGVKISPSQIPHLEEAIVSINKGTGKDNLTWWGNTASKIAPHTRSLRHLGATGLEICYVASGKLDVHINHGSHNYDYAPGSLIAKEAGAAVTNFEGKLWTIDDQNIIIGNQKLVNEVINIGYLK